MRKKDVWCDLVLRMEDVGLVGGGGSKKENGTPLITMLNPPAILTLGNHSGGWS